ncbi:MAG TPA: class I SAM-dependent methyltransferase [Patescibacteria group bacterium]
MDKVGKKTLEVMSEAHFYNKWLFKQISYWVKGDILEVGAGIGNFTELLKNKGKVTALDLNPDYIKILKKNLQGRAGFGDIEKGKYFFKNRKFDTIICMNVLEHTKDDEEALRNMFNLSKKGGRLILLVPACSFAYSGMDEDLGHWRRYNKKEAEVKLRKAGFRIERSFYLNVFGLFGWWFNGKVLGKRNIHSGQLKIFDTIAQPILKLEEIIRPPFGLSVVTVGIKK